MSQHISRVTKLSSSRLINYIQFRRDVLGFMLGMLNQGDVVSLKTGFKPSYIVNSPDFVQEILVTKAAAFKKGRTSEVLKWTLGESLLTSEKAVHEHQKKIMLPAFYKERLQGYATTIVSEACKWSDTLQEKQDCNLQDEMMQLTLSIISKTMFATDLTNKASIARSVSDTIEQTAKSLFSPILLPLAIPIKRNRIHKKAIRKLDKVIYEIIATAKENRTIFQHSLVELLLDSKNTIGHPISDQEIRDQMMTMLLAGHETSANLLSWIFYLLHRHPDVLTQLHSEIDQINLDSDHLEVYQKLPFTQMVVQEALRLYPPAWLIYREANTNISLLGESFRAGSTFMICPYAIHRNATYFPEPETFQPERFAQNSLFGPPKFAYFPFGGGPRSCIGTKFALLEVVLILAVLNKKFIFRCEHSDTVVPEPLVSLRIKGGLISKVIPRMK